MAIDLKNWMTLKRDRIRKAPWNYKKEDPFMAEQLARNIERNGQVQNCIVREMKDDNGELYYEYVNGNHRDDAYATLGIDEVVVYNCGVISDEAALRLAIETNETGFDADPIMLAEKVELLISSYGREDILLTLPYDDSDIKAMQEMAGFDWEKFQKTEEENEKKTVDETGLIPLKLPPLPPETYQVWLELLAYCRENFDLEDPIQVFEFAVLAGLKVPAEQ